MGRATLSRTAHPLLLLILLLAHPLIGDSLEFAGRSEGAGADSLQAGRIRLDYGGLEAGLLLRREEEKEEESSRLAGGVSLPIYSSVVKAGDLTIAGALSELRSPTEAGALSPLYYRYPTVGLYRGWEPSETLGLAWGLPGRLWATYRKPPDAPAETGLNGSAELLPGLRLEAAGLYFSRPETLKEGWILPDGLDSAGEHLLGGLGLIVEGKRNDLSLFGAASLHPLLPWGGYLRLQARRRGEFSLLGVRISRADRDYRIPGDSEPPFADSAAAEIRLLPALLLSPVVEFKGRREHPPLDGRFPYDWRAWGAAGLRLKTSLFRAALLREAALRREEGEYLGEEGIRGEAGLYPRPGEFLKAEASYRLGDERLEKAAIEGGLRRETLSLSGGVSWRRGSEFGEPAGELERSAAASLGITFAAAYLRLRLDYEGEEFLWRLEGGRRISLNQGENRED